MHYARVKQQTDEVYLRLPEQADQGMLPLTIAIIFSIIFSLVCFWLKMDFFPIQ